MGENEIVSRMQTGKSQAIGYQFAVQKDGVFLANRRYHHGGTSSSWSSSLTKKDYSLIQTKPQTIFVVRDHVSAT